MYALNRLLRSFKIYIFYNFGGQHRIPQMSLFNQGTG